MILELHHLLANSIWLFFLMLGLWGLVRAFRRQAVDGSYFGALVIGEGIFLLQGLLGAILYFSGARPARDWQHILYGIFALVFLPGLFTYLQGDDSNRAQWSYALGCLFLFGIALRSITTAA
jgi:hypothetical protein